MTMPDRCELCGDESDYLHETTAQPDPKVPSSVRHSLHICVTCKQALEDSDDEQCAWCGDRGSTTVWDWGPGSTDPIADLCTDCADGRARVEN